MYPLIEIKTVPIEIEMKTTNATWEYRRGTAEMEDIAVDCGITDDEAYEALEELVIEGYPTNAHLAHLILHDPDFVRGQLDTGFLDRKLDGLLEVLRTCDRLSEGAGKERT